MANSDETIWITYNGEVYNFQELRVLLEAKGYAFRTKSDTEVILHAYEAFGEACVEYLRGMFAFAIWDARRSQLFLARDRLGIKPLYYTLYNGSFLFASEIKAILQWPGIRRELEPVALRQYLLCRYVPGPLTMFKGIFKLQPGHILLLRNGTTTVRQYWDLPLDGEVSREEDPARRLRDLLTESVRLHLVSDVPLGVFLSGGIDSTTITGLMAGLVQPSPKTFTLGYTEAAGIDESVYARLAADAFKTEHREFAIGPETFWNFLLQLVWFLDEPVADSPAVSLYFISRLARQFVTVVLSGEGGDEILAGYNIYRRMLLMERWRWLPGISSLAPWFPKSKIRRYLERAQLPLEDRYRGVSVAFSAAEVERVLAVDLPTEAMEDFGSFYFDRTAALDPLKRMLYFDLKVWLPDDLLLKADKMTMATSVELRVPFLDHKLVEWTWGLPSSLKINGRTGKYLLRKAVADFVPPEILRRPKLGFAIPVKEWFQKGLGEAARRLLITEGRGCSLFNSKYVEKLILRHERGREDVSEALFTLVVLACWHRVFIDTDPLEPPSTL